MDIVTIIITVVTSLIASNGLWALILKKSEKKSKSNKLLLGLAYDRIVSLCDEYLQKETVTTEEYKNLYRYLYLPYLDNGGDGIAKMKMKQLKRKVFGDDSDNE